MSVHRNRPSLAEGEASASPKEFGQSRLTLQKIGDHRQTSLREASNSVQLGELPPMPAGESSPELGTAVMPRFANQLSALGIKSEQSTVNPSCRSPGQSVSSVSSDGAKVGLGSAQASSQQMVVNVMNGNMKI